MKDIPYELLSLELRWLVLHFDIIIPVPLKLFVKRGKTVLKFYNCATRKIKHAIKTWSDKENEAIGNIYWSKNQVKIVLFSSLMNLQSSRFHLWCISTQHKLLLWTLWKNGFSYSEQFSQGLQEPIILIKTCTSTCSWFMDINLMYRIKGQIINLINCKKINSPTPNFITPNFITPNFITPNSTSLKLGPKWPPHFEYCFIIETLMQIWSPTPQKGLALICS